MKYKLTIPGLLPGLNEYIDAERSHKGKYKAASMKRQAQNVIGYMIRTQLRGVRFTRPVVIHYLWIEPSRRRDMASTIPAGAKRSRESGNEGVSMGTRQNYQRNQRKTDGAENPLHVLPVASNLIDYTLNLTDNTKHFPKKVRFTLVNRIQDHVLSIYEKLLAANEIYPIRSAEDKARRLSLQRDALTACKMLLFFIELSKKRGYIDKGTFEYWTKIALDVKFMAAAWYKAEQAPAEKAEKAESESAGPPTQTEG